MVHRVETDFLTGLYNKETINQKICKWLKSYPTREAHMIMIDLDDFKVINDLYGHSFGDEILREVSDVLRASFEENALLSRFGGDEFVVFIMNEPTGYVENRVDSMMQRLARDIASLEQPLKCSVGIAMRMSKYDEFEDLFNRADNAMYLAKKTGKNGYYVYKESRS